jgi:hypothetical protein
MPNWCENILTIEGDESDVQRFKKLAKPKAGMTGTELSLDSLYPIPDEIKDTVPGGITIDGVYVNVWREIDGKPVAIPKDELDAMQEKYGATNWYQWRIAHWGTKWDVQATLENETPDFLVYEFESAWSPPVKWLEKVAGDFPSLRFVLRYDEPGMGFKGVAIFDQGKLIVDKYKEYA